MALICDFRDISENLERLNQFKKLYKPNITICMQKTLDFFNIINLGDNPIWYGTLCILNLLFQYSELFLSYL